MKLAEKVISLHEGVLGKLKKILSPLSNNQMSLGACVRYSEIIGEILKNRGFSVSIFDLTVDGFNHTVLLVGKNWIVDFTLSQFRKDAPFPYITKYNSPSFKKHYEMDLPFDTAKKPHTVQGLITQQEVNNLEKELAKWN